MIPHRVCLVFRGYPSTLFWVATCSAFAAGTTGSYILLGAILIMELFIALHIVRHTYTGRVNTFEQRRSGGR